MPNVLKSTVSFVAVPAGGQATLAHNLAQNNVALQPSLIAFMRSPGFAYVTSTTTTVTVQNNNALGTPAANCDLLCEWWHTIERQFPGQPPPLVLPITPIIIGEVAATVAATFRYTPPEQWVFNNVPANTANQALAAQVSTNFDTWKAIRAGSIVGLSTRLTEAVTLATADALLVSVTINGVAGTLAVSSSSGVNPSGGQSTQLAGVDTFVAGDLLGIQFTTLAAFAPITTDLEAYLQIEGA